MPIYLLLLYAAMTVLKYSSVFNNPGTISFTGSTGDISSFVPVNLIILVVNDFFILFLLNMPLVIAFSYGGVATDWLAGATKKFNAANVWKTVGKTTGDFAKRNTVSLAASRLNNSASVRSFVANNPTAGRLVTKNLGKVSKDYDKYQDEQKKDAEKINKYIGTVDRGQYGRDKAGQDAYDKAKKDAEEMQKTHRETLTEPAGKNIFTKLVKTRGSERAGYEMTEKANKKLDDEDKKKVGKKAQDDIDLKTLEGITAERNRDDEEEKIAKTLTDLSETEKKAEADISKLEEEIASIQRTNNGIMGTPVSTAKQEESLTQAKVTLASVKEQKRAQEETRTKNNNEFKLKERQIEDEKAELRKKIKAAEEIKEKERDKTLSDIKEKVDKQDQSATEKGGKSKSDEAPKTETK